MGTQAARAIYKERAATAERTNAQARNRCRQRRLVRSKAKVKVVHLWFALAHNMVTLWRLAPA
ncbi:transposase [Geminicoccaceae bacterium 1502E]|nr:transposase [Geminicoccaceae bacterium 1502E]